MTNALERKKLRATHVTLWKKLLFVLCILFSSQIYAQTETLTICSGESINFAPAGNPSSIRYTWAVPTVAPASSVSGATPQATSQVGVIQTLTNNTANPATVTYVVSQTVGSPFTLIVTVNPTPRLTNSTATTSICSGQTFIYTAASATTGSTITWTRALSTGITPNTNNGTGSISEALSNITTNPLTATYIYTLTANGCTNQQNLSVIVNPLPVLNSSLTPPAACSGSAFVYTPTANQSPNVNFNWSRAAVAGISNAAATGTGNPNETLINTTLAGITVNYVYALSNTATGCTNTQTVTTSVTPTAALNSSTSNQTICSGSSFNYNPTSLIGGASITWSRAAAAGISPASGLGNGNISEVLVNNSNIAPVTVTYEFTLNNAGCITTQSFNVTVNPTPVLSSTLNTNNICSGNTFNYTPTSAQSNVTFAWTRAVVAGISNALANGTGNPSEALNNTTNNPIVVVYTYTLTNTITGCTNTQNIFVQVSPTPSISNGVESICNGQTFSHDPTGAPTNTTYTWTTPVISPSFNITGGSAQAVESQYVSQTLNNVSGASATATYTVTPRTNGCNGPTFTVTVTVASGATPTIPLGSSFAPPPICSGNTFNYTATSSATTPTYAWRRYVTPGINEPAATGIGASISHTLTNTTTAQVTVPYAIYVTSGGCTNTHFITVAVNPATALSSSLTPDPICSNNQFSYVPTSNTPSTNQFNWSRAFVAGISNAATSGTNNPNETLINTTNSPIPVVYEYNLVTAGGCSNTQNVTVTVNPTPALSSSLTPTSVCSANNFLYNPTTLTAGGPVVFQWSRSAVTGISNGSSAGTGSADEFLVNTTINSITVPYNYTTTVNGCSSTQIVNLIVKPVPVVTNKTSTICSNTTFTTLITNVPSGTVYSWGAPVSSPAGVVTNGIAGTLESAISRQLFNTSTAPATLFYTVTPSADGCPGLSFSVAVTVNPAPVANDFTLPAICSGASFNYTPPGIQVNTIYSWSNALVTPTSAITGGNAEAGRTSIGQTLTNLTNAAASAVYTVTPIADGCLGNNFTVTVPINPVATIGTQTVAVCSGNSFSVIPTPVPSGTSYTWTTPGIVPTGAVAGAILQATPVANITQFVTNTTNLPAQAQYTVTPISGACTGSNFAVNVTVNPATALSSSLTPASICSNTTFSYVPTSNTPSTTQFNWSRAAITGINNPSASGANSFSEILVNNSNAPITVVYAYTLATSAGCTNTQNVTVVVNPIPILTSVTSAPAICSGNTLNYFPTASIGGASFSWTRSLQAFINNGAATGIGNPAEVLVNNSTNTVAAVYTYTITSNGCSSQQTVSVALNPTPIVTNQTVATCSNTAFALTPTNVPSNTLYSWTLPTYNPGGTITGGAAQVTGVNTISQTLVNSTVNSSVATYTVTPVAGACPGNPFSVAVTVQPIPVVANHALAVCSGTAFSYTPTNTPLGTTYTWLNPVINPTNTLLGGSAQTVGQSQISQTLTGVNTLTNNATYTVTPSANGCIGSAFSLAVTVNPTPVISNFRDTICSGNSFTVTPTGVPFGTTYTWATPTLVPGGSVSGIAAQVTPVNSISQILTNTITVPAQTQYNVVPVVGSCTGSIFTINVLVNPSTQLSSTLAPPAICSNTNFSYIPTSNTPSTTGFNWSRASVAGITNAAASGTNGFNEILVNNTNAPIVVTYVYNLVTAGGCTNTQSVNLTVNPIPVLTSLANAPAICGGGTFNYFPSSNVTGTSFVWSRSVQAFINNGAANGINNPAEILISNAITTVPVVYNYTLSANGCSNQQTVTVNVNPTPNISNQFVTTCSNAGFSLTPANIPTNTLFTWGAPTYNPGGTITGGTAQLVGVNAISQTLANQTINSSLATYTVIPVSGACTGNAFALAVTVQPIPVVANQTLSTVCSGTAFTYVPTNVPTGTTYTWLNPLINPANTLTGGSAQSVATAQISQTLSSTNNVANTASYIVTPAFNGCVGNDFTLTVIVNPTPVVNNIIDTICTGSSVNIIPGSVPVNTRYTWPNPTVQPFGAIIGATGQAFPTGNIFQTLVNSTNTPARVVYAITPIAGSCSGSPFALTVHVGSLLPAIANQADEICSGTAFNATPINAPAGTTYTWTLPTINPAGTVAGMTNAIYQQPIVSELLNNTSANNSIAVYTVTAKNTGCISNTFTATITVLPVPRVTITGNNVICRYPFDTLSLRFTGGAPWSFTYTDDNGAPINITGITNAPYQLSVPASSTTTRVLAFTNIQHGACLNTVDTTKFTQIINPLPVGTMNTRRGIYLCNNISDTLFITSPERLTYQWLLDGAALNGATNDSLVTGLPGRYNTILQNEFGCLDTIAQGITLIKIEQPILQFAYDTYCINTPMNLTNLTDTNRTGPIIWRWDFGNGNIQGTYNAQNIYAVGGNHEIRLTANQVYCPATPTTMDSVVNIHIPIPGVNMPSVSAYKTVPLPIAVRSIPGYRYRWTPSWGINRPNDASVTFNYTTTQQYAVELISQAGCITRDSLLVRVFDDKLVEILIPKSFTPNGDGVNDKLFPYLSGIKEFKYFKVYNRFNQLMFETRNHDEGWNGTLNGTQQPMGIYIWVAMGLAQDGSIVQRTGQTLLLR